MVLLKEDGNMDVERINQLLIEEYINMLGELTPRQMDYYLSKFPVNEGKEYPRNIIVDYTMDDEIKRGTGVDLEIYLKKWKDELDNK